MPARPAMAAPYAAIVMDMRDGTVLHSRSADRRQPPASLTKMMTLYLVFEAIRDGKLSLDQRVRVSAAAAAMPPSDLRLRVGERVTVRSLIRASAIKSANDAAVVLAEAVAGTESEFARRMTRRARELGMASTTFLNATGLTRRGHLSTARDMAVMGRHLFYDFPQYYNLFSRRRANAAGRTVVNTNRLLGSYEGADGIKTGYTSAAGYNLVASALRGEERIIAVIFGGRSSRSRNRRMVELLDMGFERAPRRVAVVRPAFVGGAEHAAGHERAAAVAEAPLPPPRPGSTVVLAAAAPEGSILERGAAALGEALTPASAAAAVPPPDAVPAPTSSSPHAPVLAGLPPVRPGGPVAPTLAPRAGSPVVVLAEAPIGGAPPGEWAVQVGAFADHERAVARLAAISLGDVAPLSGAEPVIDARRRSSGSDIYLVRFTGMSRSGARLACEEITGRGGDCLPIAPRPGN